MKYSVARILGNARKEWWCFYTFFLNFLLRARFRSVKLGEQRPAGRGAVSGSALPMSSFPDCGSRRARRLQRRASSGATIAQNSTGREERSRAEPSRAFAPAPVRLGVPAGCGGCSSPQWRLPSSPPAVLSCVLQEFSHWKEFWWLCTTIPVWGTVIFYQVVKSPPL